jgi:uncharacterized protein (DUF58 family)
VREFDQETGGDVWLLLDLDQDVQIGSGEESTLEVGILLVASLVTQLLEANRRVGLLTYGQRRHVIRPGQGRAHLWRILRVLALAQPAQQQPLAQTVAEAGRVVPPGSTLIVLTPSASPAWAATLARLRRRGVVSKALFLAHGDTMQLRSMRSLLSGLAIETEVVNVLTPLPVVPATGRPSQWEFKVLPTGRAIAINRPRGRGERWPG